MHKLILTGSLVVVVLCSALLIGCKDNMPATELERFLMQTGNVEGTALEDTLRTYLGQGAPYAVYANFLLGNRYYEAATDSAQSAGWGSDAAKALLDSAEIYLTQAVELDSTFIEGLVNLGSLWDDRSEMMSSRQEQDERVAMAEGFYNQALTVEPYNEKARCNLGSLYLRQRKTQEALAEFQGVLDHDPHSALAHYNLAIMFAEAKIYREAKVEWQLASKYDKDGDIGNRSRDNIKIVHDLMNAEVPANVKK